MDNAHVMFVGDADDLWFELSRCLEDEGLTASRWEYSALQPDRSAIQEAVAVVVGPAVAGAERLELCREVRSSSVASVTVISEVMDEVDEMRLVVAGACVVAYLSIRPRVMAAQLANRIGRNRSDASQSVLTFRRLQVDPIEHVAMIDGHAVELTKTEFDLLVLLMGKPRQVYTHEAISRWLWDDPCEVDHHRLEAHVCRLRKKVSQAGGPAIIGSVRGVGYRLIASSEMSTPSPLAS
jgi:DNA-binding response OmpR family regulator